MSQVAIILAEAVVLHDEVSEFPVPEAADEGGLVDVWRRGTAFGPDKANIYITADKAVDLDGLAVYSVGDDDAIGFVALLYEGATIQIQKPGAAVVGYQQQVESIGGAKRLIVAGFGADGVLSDVTAKVTVTAAPLEER